jgi:FkbM family methyltransferase
VHIEDFKGFDMAQMPDIKEHFVKLKRFWKKIKYRLWNKYSLEIYSQEGEDVILDRLFEEKLKGFYIDIGAHHPRRFSNSYYFYRKGWRGINIDAMPGSMTLFNKIRPEDINIEMAVADGNHKRTYYILDDPALNGFFDERNPLSPSLHSRIVKTIVIPTATLGDLLDKAMLTSREIDFMSIDVEGMEMEILNSNNWIKYKPKVILVEMRESTIMDVSTSVLGKFLKEKGYDFFCKTLNTAFFRKRH